MKKHKFYNFTFNNGEKSNNVDLMLYGAIVSGENEKWSDDEVEFIDFRNAIDKISDNGTLNIYQNSPGGDCFVTSAIVSLLNRAKQRGITINAYIDSLSASASSWISCCADNLYIYPNSIMMIHPPMSFVMGNANDFRKEIDVLDKIENDVMLPIYMSKVKEGITEDYIKELINAETWLTASEMADIFDVELMENDKKIVACVDENVFKNYNNVPKHLIDEYNENLRIESEIKKNQIEKEYNDKLALLEIELELL